MSLQSQYDIVDPALAQRSESPRVATFFDDGWEVPHKQLSKYVARVEDAEHADYWRVRREEF